MKAQENGRTIKWLLDGDIAIQYQVYRDLLDIQRDDLRDRTNHKGLVHFGNGYETEGKRSLIAEDIFEKAKKALFD
ncbi:MAG: hypothetical protein COW71_09485 [Ignavibacteriales bacterium CG18_big_fil_WC_8_21_14_2_50_31_20]|nr:MAG: hypothetical protein COW71_09485 [Ignavibacteriales bacterium CG18_big_fil_WC_8_21_14_2_50_31_20]